MSDELPERTFTMSELVERTGVPAATVRYYLTVGLLPPPVKVAANRFLYDVRHVEVIRFVRLLRERRGLSLESIGRLLPELLPDLLGKRESTVFRPEMWGRLLSERSPSEGPSAGERLLEAGLVAFSRHGYAEVSVDDVCRAAGIAKGSFYRHYASKEELFFAAAAAAGTRAARRFTDSLPESASSEETVAALSDALAPHLSVLLDLAALAAQRRPGHARVLRALVAEVNESVRARFDTPGEGEAEAVLERAVIRALRGVVADRPVVPSGSERHRDGAP